MQRGRKAVMRAECERNATVKARRQGKGERSKRGKKGQPSQKRKRALALNTTTDKNTTLKPPRLFPFAPFGEVCPFLPLAPFPFTLASLLLRLHPLASACIGFSPFASACIGLQALSLPFGVGWSAGRVGGRLVVSVVGWSCRLVVSAGRLVVSVVGWSPWLSLQLAPFDAQIQRKQGIKHPAFFILTLHPFVYDCKSSDL